MPGLAENSEYYSPAEASAELHLQPRTLRLLAEAGKITYTLTLGGHRRYKGAEIRALAAFNRKGIQRKLAGEIRYYVVRFPGKPARGGTMTDEIKPIPWQVTRTWTVMAVNQEHALSRATPGTHQDVSIKRLPCDNWPASCRHIPSHATPRPSLRRIDSAEHGGYLGGGQVL